MGKRGEKSEPEEKVFDALSSASRKLRELDGRAKDPHASPDNRQQARQQAAGARIVLDAINKALQ